MVAHQHIGMDGDLKPSRRIAQTTQEKQIIFGRAKHRLAVMAVLGGVLVGTCSTLLFVPFLYANLRTRAVKPLKDYA